MSKQVLKYIAYKNSNVDNQLYLDDDLICQDLRNCKAFMKFLNLKLISEEIVQDGFCGEYTIYLYVKA